MSELKIHIIISVQVWYQVDHITNILLIHILLDIEDKYIRQLKTVHIAFVKS